MDDIMDSVDSLGEAEKITGEIDEVLDKGEFRIKEWVYSGIRQKRTVDADKIEQRTIQLLSNSGIKTNTERVIGMEWDPKNDSFGYDIKLNFSVKKRKVHSEPDLSCEQVPAKIPQTLTKRQVLSQVNRVYDPMGLVPPFTVRAKMMLRKLWGHENKLDWDDPIPEHLKREWITFFEELVGEGHQFKEY